MSVPVNFRDLVIAERMGQGRRTEWVKNVNQVTTAGLWFDVSGSSGNPKAKQWFDATPLVAQQVKASTDGGIYHGAPVSPATKYASPSPRARAARRSRSRTRTARA